MFRFADPDYLYWLGIIPLFAGIYAYTRIQARRKKKLLGDPDLLKRLVPDYSSHRPLIKFVLLETILALIIVMLARPQFGLVENKDVTKGIEVVFVMDVSNSMLAQDIRPNRLERSKLMVSNLIDNMKNDKIALAVFAGEAYPQLPITNDYTSAKMFLDQITPGMVTLQGTNIAAAIELGRKSFTDRKDVGKALIIITDGENHEENAIEAAQAAVKEGIKVFILGVGSTAGSKIVLPDGSILTDGNGQEVISKLNEQMCREVAKAGKGSYFHVTNTNTARQQLQEQLNNLQKADSTGSYSVYDEQFIAVALLVLILLIAEMFISETKGSWTKKIKPFGK